MYHHQLQLLLEKMRSENCPPIATNIFEWHFHHLVSGKSNEISENDIDPVDDNIISISELGSYAVAGEKALSNTCIIKLNGGLGTSMGLSHPKSLIEAKNGLSFLEITINQVLQLNKKYRVKIPFITMDSFRTQPYAVEIISKYKEIATSFPCSLLQHKFPKISSHTFGPVQWPQNRELEWNPPGHGDIFASLVTSGILDMLIDGGIRYAFVSNIDNLGATLDERILGYFVESNFSFMMEVAKRTESDIKGGHIARLKNGRLVLRESAQCNSSELKYFTDIKRHCFFNTNNIWLNLLEIKKYLKRHNNIIPLSTIINKKPIDPTDPNSAKIIQLETAIGSAISVFENSSVVLVGRERFIPVKKCSDLLRLWSDFYKLTDAYNIEATPNNTPVPHIELDEKYYSIFKDFKERFGSAVPSLKECSSLKVIGNVFFGKNVLCKGNVSIYGHENLPCHISDTSIVDDKWEAPNYYKDS